MTLIVLHLSEEMATERKSRLVVVTYITLVGKHGGKTRLDAKWADHADIDVETHRWWVNKKRGLSYATRILTRGERDGNSKTVPMHNVVAKLEGMVVPPGCSIDHIDRDTLNNCACNLRVATQRMQVMNQRVKSNNTSRFVGVQQRGSGWNARINVKGGQRTLGTYNTPEEASIAYQTAWAEQWAAAVAERDQIVADYIASLKA
jgi:hypothetical protein